MKQLFLVLLLVFGFVQVANASPFLQGEPFDAGVVEECVVVFNGEPLEAFAPIAIQEAGKAVCSYDLAEAPEGANQITLKYVNIWGETEAIPFGFTKALPPTPTGLHLSR